MSQFSSQYHKRKYYKKIKQVPSFREAKCQLGEELAKVLYDKCPESLLDEMHLSSTLHTPGPTLWISPSDILIGKVVLKPPLTATHIKALTHEGILEFGEEVEREWMAAMEEEKRLALENLEELLMLLGERITERAVAESLAKAEAEFAEYLSKLNTDFEKVLKTELARLEETLRDYYEALMARKEAECLDAQEEMQRAKIREAVNAIVQELTEKFMHDLEEQERELEAMFQAKIEGQREKFAQELKFQEESFAIMIQQLKHNLHCNNISNLMYVLCMERRKCLRDQQTIVDCTSEKIYELEQKAEVDKVEIESLQQKLVEYKRQATVREDCLLGVLTQFQKFINYALRAAPTQAEFLLSVEKMMTFELTQALARTQDGKQPHLAKQFMPWRHISKETILTQSTLVPKTYHDCLNEKTPIRKVIDLDDELYAVNFKDHVYVREDFRNMVEQGLMRKTSSVLWTKELDDLVTLIKNANYEEEKGESICEDTSPKNIRSGSSSVHFETHADRDAADAPCLLAVRDSLFYANPDPPSPEEQKEFDLGYTSSQGVNLLAVTDSITLLKEKHLSTSNYFYGPEDEGDIIPMEKEIETTTTKRSSLKHTKATQISISFEELEIIQAPSQATLRLRKAHRRETAMEQLIMRDLSQVTIKLNKHKSTPKPIAKEASIESGVMKKKRLTNPSIPLLSFHRDSLELVQQHKGNNAKLKNIIVPVNPADPQDRTEHLVINTPSETRDFPDVNFQKIAQVFHELYTPGKPWQIYEKNITSASAIRRVSLVPPTNFLEKPTAVKVIGDPKVEVNKTTRDFTIHRMHSLMDVLKKDDSLIRMFTRGTQ